MRTACLLEQRAAAGNTIRAPSASEGFARMNRSHTRPSLALRALMSLIAALITAPSSGQTSKPARSAQSPKKKDPHQLAPPVHGPELVRRAEEARRKGFAFLVKSQNVDGSWGSHDPRIARLADFGFKLRNRGSQDGVRMACTAICAAALLDKSDRTAGEQKALERAVEVLFDEGKFAYHRNEAFNTWGYGYKLDFVTRWLESSEGAADRARVEATARVCTAGLRRFQQADGGWNYYAGPTMGGASMSFNTATFVLALQRAKRLGLDFPEAMMNDAVKLLKRMRTMKGGFVYDARFLHNPRAVNELSAGARTAVCALALHNAGVFGEADLLKSLAVFNESENYLEDGRKLIQPHTAVHQVSGYFYFYGYHYATILAERLGQKVDRRRWDRFAWTFVRTQEPNGSWWDTPAGDYGNKWGTGFALQGLQRFLSYVQREPSGAK